MKMRTMIHRTARAATVLCAAAVVGALTVPANAQNALGGGDALDSNLSTTSKRNAPTPDQGLTYRVRNLLVTGNVVGGRGFRDTVGYTAETDFRSATGSDDLFQFRAQSATSAPTYILYGDQLNELQLGQDLGALEFRRDFTGATLSDVSTRGQRSFDSRLGDTELRIDRLISDISVAEDVERWVESRPIGIGVDREGRVVVPMTTSVLGIDQMSYSEAVSGLSVLDRAQLRQDMIDRYQQQMTGQQSPQDPWQLAQQRQEQPWQQQPGQATGQQQQQQRQFAMQPLSDVVGNRLETRFEDLLTWESRIDAMDTSARVQAEMPGYESVLKSVADRFADGEEIDEEKAGELDDQYATVRRFLEGRGMPLPGEEDDASQWPGDTDTGVDEGEDAGETGDDTDTVPPAVPLPDDDVTPTLESFGIVLRHGQRLSTYASGDDSRFNELVRQAQQSLESGEYFWAERRFSRALLFNRNHPLATAGKAHAQLGAGLYQPAAMTLRRLFTQYPEMIDVRYERALLPPRTRLAQCIESIRQRTNNNNEAAHMGLLLAYIGHQWDDQALIEEGLTAMKRHRPEDPLLTLLDSIWQQPEDDDDANDGGQ